LDHANHNAKFVQANNKMTLKTCRPALAPALVMAWLSFSLSLCVLLTAGLIYPHLNWDMLAYAGNIAAWQGGNPAQIQARAYGDLAQLASWYHLSPAYAALADDGRAYRHILSHDPAAFVQALPFYRPRPLYLAALWAMSRLTGNIAAAGVLLGTLSSFCAVLVFARYATERLGTVTGLFLAAIFGASPPVLAVAAEASPDSLALLVTLSGFVLMLAKKPRRGATMLLLACAIRTDIAVQNAAIGIICLLAQYQFGKPNIPKTASWLLLASVPVAATINHLCGAYSFSLLYYNSFIDFLPYPATAQIVIPLRRVATAIVFGAVQGFGNGAFSLPLMVAPLLWWRRAHTNSAAWPMLAAGLYLGLVMRVAIYPVPELRLAAPVFGGLALCLLASLSEAA
jgi:hypothetical protein